MDFYPVVCVGINPSGHLRGLIIIILGKIKIWQINRLRYVYEVSIIQRR
jgi:hypothetical protein